MSILICRKLLFNNSLPIFLCDFSDPENYPPVITILFDMVRTVLSFRIALR